MRPTIIHTMHRGGSWANDIHGIQVGVLYDSQDAAVVAAGAVASSCELEHQIHGRDGRLTEAAPGTVPGLLGWLPATWLVPPKDRVVPGQPGRRPEPDEPDDERVDIYRVVTSDGEQGRPFLAITLEDALTIRSLRIDRSHARPGVRYGLELESGPGRWLDTGVWTAPQARPA